MTTHEDMERVRKLAAQSAAWEAQDGIPTVCTCPTCGVANARLRGALVSRGWSRCATHQVTVRGNDFSGGAYPYLATVRVNGVEVYRIDADLDEVLKPEVMADIEAALKRQPKGQQCSL